MHEPLKPKDGFDWTRVQWTGPYALVEWETCSYCGGAMSEDAVPLRMWNDEGWAAVFCEACMQTWFGFEPVGWGENDDDYHEDDQTP